MKKNHQKVNRNNYILLGVIFQKDPHPSYILIFISLFFLQCTSTQPYNQSTVDSSRTSTTPNNTIPPIEIKKVSSLNNLEQLTREGINDQIHIAANGLKIIYISQKKSKHDHTQIYEMDLKTRTEKRLTYQDGYLTSPIILNENEIAYSSSTDEIKENPLSTKKDDQTILEVYLSDRFGNQIQRLTKRSGYDSQVAHSQYLDQYIYYVVKKDNKSWIQRIDRTTNESVVYLQSEVDLLSMPKFSPNGKKMAWLSQNLKTQNFALQFGDLTPNHLVLKKSITVVNLPFIQVNSLNWTDDQKGIWLTGKFDQKDFFQIYYFSINENCIKQITQENLNIKDVQDIPFNQESIIFSLGKDLNSQIFTAKRPVPDAFKCLEIPKT